MSSSHFIPLKAVFTVKAGIVPGQAMPQYTKQWAYTSEDYEADGKLPPMPEGHSIDMNGPLDQPHMSKFTRMHIEAMRYYSQMVHPYMLNWVTIEWMWL